MSEETFSRDALFQEMFDSLETDADRDLLSKAGSYLYTEHGYTFTGLRKDTGIDVETLMADALLAGEEFASKIDDEMAGILQRRRRSASLIGEMDYVEDPLP